MTGRRKLFGTTSRAAASALAMLALGCGSDNPATHPVSGVVTHKGKPLADVSVTFIPWGGTKGAPAVGRTDAEGKFTLTTYEPGDGAVEGTHRVTVAQVTPAVDESKPMTNDDYKAPPPPPFPMKYMTPDSTDIQVTVPATGEVAVDLK